MKQNKISEANRLILEASQLLESELSSKVLSLLIYRLATVPFIEEIENVMKNMTKLIAQYEELKASGSVTTNECCTIDAVIELAQAYIKQRTQ